MAIRVAHVGTGNVGRLALAELITNPQFELTGLCVSSPEKVGKDAGELAASAWTPRRHRHQSRQRPRRPAGHRARVRRLLRHG